MVAADKRGGGVLCAGELTCLNDVGGGAAVSSALVASFRHWCGSTSYTPSSKASFRAWMTSARSKSSMLRTSSRRVIGLRPTFPTAPRPCTLAASFSPHRPERFRPELARKASLCRQARGARTSKEPRGRPCPRDAMWTGL